MLLTIRKMLYALPNYNHIFCTFRSIPASSPKPSRSKPGTPTNAAKVTPTPSPKLQPEDQIAVVAEASPKPSPRRQLDQQNNIVMRSPSFVSPSRIRPVSRQNPSWPVSSTVSPMAESLNYPGTKSPYVSDMLKVRSPGDEKQRVKKNLMH